jgi:AcrR family transcriptional regulator
VRGRGLDRDVVVAAAAEIADADGLEAVTVARVAAVLGVRGPSIYNHVAGRDGLLHGVALSAVRGLTDALRRAAVGREGEEALLAVALAYRAYAHAHPGRYEAMQRAPADGDDERRAATAEALELLSGVLRGWSLTGDDEIHAIRALRSALHGFVDLERVGGFGLPVAPEASYERLVRSLASGLRRGTRD